MILPKTSKARKLFHNGLQSLNRATIKGMRLDVGYCKNINKKLNKKLANLEKELKGSKFGKRWRKIYPNMKIKSDDQLSNILFNKMNMPIIKFTDKGNPSVDSGVLEILARGIPDLKIISKYKVLYVANNTFIKAFLREQVDGYIHPEFALHVIKTFRSGSYGPNFQQNPKRNPIQKEIVRRAIIPRKGHQFIAADFGGIEVRCACCVTKDKQLTHDTIHGDMHRDMAIEIYKLDDFIKKGYEKELRFAGKNGFVFPEFYGDFWKRCVPSLLKLANLPLKGTLKPKSGKKLMTGLYMGKHLRKKGIRSVKDFEKHVQAVEYSFWKERYKTYDKWKKDTIQEYKKKGYLITKTGFVCQGIMSNNEITNYPMQGPAFHTLLKCFNETDRRQQKNKWISGLVAQIHDEMILDAHPNETDYILDILKEIMTNWILKKFKWITVPLEVEADVYPVDGSWAEEAKTVVF